MNTSTIAKINRFYHEQLFEMKNQHIERAELKKHCLALGIKPKWYYTNQYMKKLILTSMALRTTDNYIISFIGDFASKYFIIISMVAASIILTKIILW